MGVTLLRIGSWIRILSEHIPGTVVRPMAWILFVTAADQYVGESSAGQTLKGKWLAGSETESSNQNSRSS